MDHVATEEVGPFEHLGPDVLEEGVGGPAAEDHDFGDGVVHEEEGHGRSGTEGPGANVGGVVTERRGSTEEGARGPEVLEEEGAGEKHDGVPVDGGVDGSLRGGVRDAAVDALHDRGEAANGAHYGVERPLVGALVVLVPFFWLRKVTVTRSASANRGWSCGTTSLAAFRKTTPPKAMILVRPGVGVVVTSQDRMA